MLFSKVRWEFFLFIDDHGIGSPYIPYGLTRFIASLTQSKIALLWIWSASEIISASSSSFISYSLCCLIYSIASLITLSLSFSKVRYNCTFKMQSIDWFIFWGSKSSKPIFPNVPFSWYSIYACFRIWSCSSGSL